MAVDKCSRGWVGAMASGRASGRTPLLLELASLSSENDALREDIARLGRELAAAAQVAVAVGGCPAEGRARWCPWFTRREPRPW